MTFCDKQELILDGSSFWCHQKWLTGIGWNWTQVHRVTDLIAKSRSLQNIDMWITTQYLHFTATNTIAGTRFFMPDALPVTQSTASKTLESTGSTNLSETTCNNTGMTDTQERLFSKFLSILGHALAQLAFGLRIVQCCVVAADLRHALHRNHLCPRSYHVETHHKTTELFGKLHKFSNTKF